MADKKTGGSAFPHSHDQSSGMTWLDFVAAIVASSMARECEFNNEEARKQWVVQCYDWAEALLAEKLHRENRGK